MELEFNNDKIFSLLKGRAEEVEIIQQSSRSFPVIFKANNLNSSETNFSCSAGIRVIADGKIGFAVSNNPEKIESLVERALKSASFGEKALFTLPDSAKSNKTLPSFSEEVSNLSREDKINLGKEYIEAIRAKFPKINIDLEVDSSESKVSLENSKGLSINSSKSIFGIGYSALSVDDNGLLWISDGNSSCKLDIRKETQIEKSIKLLTLAQKVVKAGMPKTIIMEPSCVSTIAASFLAGINGKQVFKGSSPLSDKIGKEITDKRFSLIEDPTLEYKPASAIFDGEGVKRNKQALIEYGILKHFIYDLQTAGLTSNKSTGNASRGVASLPSPGYTNLLVPAGNKTVAEMIAETKDGLWVHSVLGSGQSNMLAGDFALNAHLAYKIENGQIIGRVKDTMFSGNVYDVFKKIIDISSEINTSGSSMFPAISFDGISVSQ